MQKKNLTADDEGGDEVLLQRGRGGGGGRGRHGDPQGTAAVTPQVQVLLAAATVAHNAMYVPHQVRVHPQGLQEPEHLSLALALSVHRVGADHVAQGVGHQQAHFPGVALSVAVHLTGGGENVIFSENNKICRFKSHLRTVQDLDNGVHRPVGPHEVAVGGRRRHGFHLARPQLDVPAPHEGGHGFHALDLALNVLSATTAQGGLRLRQDGRGKADHAGRLVLRKKITQVSTPVPVPETTNCPVGLLEYETFSHIPSTGTCTGNRVRQVVPSPSTTTTYYSHLGMMEDLTYSCIECAKFTHRIRSLQEINLFFLTPAFPTSLLRLRTHLIEDPLSPRSSSSSSSAGRRL